jgi:dTDP-4-amino-4,6-dideoxygalactose transaminase
MSDISLPIYDKQNCALFALGRNAMYAACRLLKLSPGDEVLTPAFDCDSALQPFRVLGYKLRFYRSDPYTLNADIHDLRMKINRKTKLLHIINHFGMPQPWEELLAIREATGIPIMEDNAFSLFSTMNGRRFGTFGDVAIFSLRKELPLTDGGMLRVNNPMLSLNGHERRGRVLYPSEFNIMLSGVKRRVKFDEWPELFQRLLEGGRHVPDRPPPLYSDGHTEVPHWPLRDRIGSQFQCDYLRPMSMVGRFQLIRLSPSDYGYFSAEKRELYSRLSRGLKDVTGLQVLWPKLPDGVVPFCLSLLVPRKRDVFLAALKKKYDITAWPTLSSEVLKDLDEYPDVRMLGKQLLQINLASSQIRARSLSGKLPSLVHDFERLSRKWLKRVDVSDD